MIRTKEELQKQAKEKEITFYPVHECSMCRYMCGYLIEDDIIGYDSGCDCVSYNNIEERSWEDLTATYNLNQPENNPNIKQEYLDKLNEIWKF